MCGTSIMGLMMLGAAMGDIDHHPRRRATSAEEALEKLARRSSRSRFGGRLMPRQITAFSNTTVKRLRSLRDKKARTRGRPVPRRGPADHHRGARQRPAARDRRFLGRGREASAGRRDHRRDRGRGRRCDRDHRRHPLARCRARTIRRCCSAPTASRTTALDAIDRADGAAVDRRPGAARSRQYRHHPAHRRRGRRRRADPDRRQRRPLFGRGGARVDGRDLHPSSRDGALGRVPRLAARRPGPAGRHQPQGRHRTISTPTMRRPASC